MFGRKWKLEGSVFNGREPDEDRYDVDLARLDSYAGRLSIMPDERWSLQVSMGRLNDAEPAHEPGEPRRDITRPTASLIHHGTLGHSGVWTSALVWGRNIEDGHTTDAVLGESSLNLDERNIIFARAELTEKAGEDLALDDEQLEQRIFNVGKVQIGYARQFAPLRGLLPGIGASIALNFVPTELEPFYGRMPTSIAFFASIRPTPMSMARMSIADMEQGAMPPAEHLLHQPAPPPPPDSERVAGAHAGHERTPQGREMDSGVADQLRLMHEIHARMMADPVIRERVAMDPMLQQLMEGMNRAVGDSAVTHAAHRAARAGS